MDDDESNVHKIETACRILVDAALIIDESRALSFALAATLASSSRADLSPDEIDNLCQSAYELFRRQNKIKEIFDGAVEELHCKSWYRLADLIAKSKKSEHTENGYRRSPGPEHTPFHLPTTTLSEMMSAWTTPRK
jgi:hypothetical protein